MRFRGSGGLKRLWAHLVAIRHYCVLYRVQAVNKIRLATVLYWRDFDRPQKILLLIMAFCVMLLPTAIIVGSLPFEPYTFRSYTVVPDRVCPSEPVKVRVDSSIENPTFGRIGNVEVNTGWISADGRRTAYRTTPLGNVKPFDGEIASAVLRTAPTDPGRWYVDSTVMVEGRVAGISREQSEPSRADDPVTVVSGSSEGCA